MEGAQDPEDGAEQEAEEEAFNEDKYSLELEKTSGGLGSDSGSGLGGRLLPVPLELENVVADSAASAILSSCSPLARVHKALCALAASSPPPSSLSCFPSGSPAARSSSKAPWTGTYGLSAEAARNTTWDPELGVLYAVTSPQNVHALSLEGVLSVCLPRACCPL